MTLRRRIAGLFSRSTDEAVSATYAPEVDGEPDPGEVGSGGWDPQGRPSEVRLDRLLHLRRDGVRREGAALDPAIFDEVVAAVRGLSR